MPSTLGVWCVVSRERLFTVRFIVAYLRILCLYVLCVCDVIESGMT